MKNGLIGVALGICAFSLICLGTPSSAGTDSSTTADKASATLRFVIHIPETLSMRIAGPHGSNRFFTQDKLKADGRSDKTLERQQVIQVEIMGNVTTGGTMALSTDNAVPHPNGGSTLHPRSSLIWTTKGVLQPEHRPGEDTNANNAASPTPHTFFFSKKHPFRSDRIDRQLVYTVSAP